MTKEQIIEKVKKNMKTIGWLDYVKEIGIECWDKKERETPYNRELYGYEPTFLELLKALRYNGRSVRLLNE